MRISRTLLSAGLACMAIAAPAAPPTADIAYLRLTDSFWQVWTMDADGAHQRQWTDDLYDYTRLSWGPDHDTLLLNRADGTLHQLDLATGAVQPMPVATESVFDAQWSPDGKWIVYSRMTTGTPDNNNLWRVRADGSGLSKLTNQPELQMLPAWGPGSLILAYSAGKNLQSHEIYVLDIDAGSVQQVSGGEGLHFDPAFSPDGRLAYSANIKGDYDLWWMPADFGTRIQLTEHPAFDGEPSWSPDGTSLVFTSFRGQQKRIWRVAVDDGEPVPLTPAGTTSRSPAWAN